MFRVNAECYPVAEMKHVNWLLLPPAIEHFYKIKNPLYASPPPFAKNCITNGTKSIEMIYPRFNAKIYVPVELEGNQGKAVFQLAHRVAGTTVFWDLDGVFLGSTEQFHQMVVNPEKGKHLLTVTDAYGESLTVPFEITSEKKEADSE
jgi:penicillin-binding protein 1C